jgi:hypothetical protein
MEEIKPILFIRGNNGQPSKDAWNRMKEEMKEATGNQYHILLSFCTDRAKPVIEAEVLNAEQLTEEKLEELKTLLNYGTDKK